jgi:uncharacterized protein
MAPTANSHDPGLTGTEADAETDAGPARSGGKAAREPLERRCIATMERRPSGDMIRFVLSPDGQVTPDLAARLPGRGAWVTATREALETAVKRGAFARAFKAAVKPGPDLVQDVEKLLVKRAMDMLGLAKRSGDLILGFETVRDQIRSAPPACVIEASDGAEDGRGKVLGLLRAAHDPRPGDAGYKEAPKGPIIPVVGCFSAGELGMALGRDRVIHACLKQGRPAQAWMADVVRLAGFRPVWPVDWRPFDLRSGDERDVESRGETDSD